MSRKRKLYDELMEGMDSMRRQREGKITLRTHEVEDLPPLEVDADTISGVLCNSNEPNVS